MIDNSQHLILIVDDDEDGGPLIESVLRNLNFQTAIAKDGAEGIAYLTEHIPHIILLDVRMPRMNGEQVLKWIRKHNYLNDCVVIMLTMLNTKEDVLNFLRMGADDYIVKPASIISIQEKIHTHIKRHQQRILHTLNFINQETQIPILTLQTPATLIGLGESALGFKSKWQFRSHSDLTISCKKLNNGQPIALKVHNCLKLANTTDFLCETAVINRLINPLATSYMRDKA